MKIGAQNEFQIPIPSTGKASFIGRIEGIIEGAGCLLVEWSNGDNLIVDGSPEAHLTFSFFAGGMQRWKVSTAQGRIIANKIAWDVSGSCEHIRGRCQVAGSFIDETNAPADHEAGERAA